ncbi:MAG: hypothetical protein WA966_14410 [Ornithinimicrobium sp.]
MTKTPLKHLVRLNELSLGEDTDPEGLIRYLDIGSVSTGVLVEEPKTMSFSEAPSRARRLVREGDTIVSTVRTYLRAVWPVRQSASGLVVSTGFAVLTPRPELDSRYLGWIAQSDPFVDGVVARSVGVSYPAVNPSEIGELRIDLPPLSVQRAIADYLDTETASIDALISRKQQLVSLLQQRRWLFFLELLNATDAPVAPLRRALLGVVDGPFGSAFSSADYVDQGVGVIRLGNIGFARWRGDDLVYLPEERFAEFRGHSVRQGDLLIAALGDPKNHAGRACVAPDLGNAIVKGKCFRATVDTAVADPHFLALFCSSPAGADAIATEVRGSTRSMINLDIVKSMQVRLPDLETQTSIVADTSANWVLVDRLLSQLSAQVSLFHEHRAALITAAVTGELKIPGVAS